MFPPKDTMMIQLNWKLRLSSGHSGLLMPLNQQTKKGLMLLVRVTDPDYQGKSGLLLQVRKSMSGIWGIL